MKILVTGANGFLGSHVLDTLSMDYKVDGLVRKKSNIQDILIHKENLLYSDLLDRENLQNLIIGYDVIVHTAGFMSAYPKDRQKLYDINTKGTQNILDACVKNQIPKFIHISSAVTCGASLKENVILNEESNSSFSTQEFANYDSKRKGEEIVLNALKEKSISGVVLNPSLMYGKRDARKPVRKSNLMAIKGKLKFYTSGGANIVSVHDVVDVIKKSIQINCSPERYLVTGENMHIKDLLQKISFFARKKGPQKMISTQLLMNLSTINDFLGLNTMLCKESIFAATAFHWYDSAKAIRVFGYTPRPADDAIKESVEWALNNMIGADNGKF